MRNSVIAMAVLGALLLALSTAGPAQAAIFNVTTTADTNDGCDSQCSLREGIGAAAAAAGGDTVNVPAGTYVLSSGELVYSPQVAAALTLTGAGARTTVIDGADVDNVLDIVTGSAAISGLTMRNGSATFTGGGLQTSGGTTTTLQNVTVADNLTGDGGDGGGIHNGGTMTLLNVAVTGNQTSFGGQGAGIYTSGSLTLTNVTVSGNSILDSPSQGGGIYLDGRPIAFTNVTVTGNQAGTGGTGGGIYVNTPATFQNTIVAGNLAGATASECFLAAAVTSNGGNLEGGTSCSFTGGSDEQNANPLLGPLQDNGGETNTHALGSGSPAVNGGTNIGCPVTDQRGVARPQGPACDVGAYELVVSEPPPADGDGDGVPDLTDACPTTPAATPTGCPPFLGFQAPADTDGDGVPNTTDACPTVPANTANGCPLPPPQLGVTFNVVPLSGEVFVGMRAGAARAGGGSGRASQVKGVNFVPLRELRQIPIGSFLDTRKGRVRIRSARDGSGGTQIGEFSAGVFQVLQSRKRSAKGLTELRLKGSSFRSCRRAHGSVAQAARHRLSRRARRRLRSNARGRFRTRGRYAAATVRGTTWTTTDRCDGTLTRVKRGKVVVRDLRRKRNVLVRAGKSYLARARR
jgi:CSLREA domain-containing protein